MRKHILMVLDEEFPPDDRVYKEAQSLIKEEFDVAIACYTFSDRPDFEEMDGIRIFRKKISKFIYKSSVATLTFPVYFNWWKKHLQEIFQTNTFDIIHIHDLPLTKVGVHFKQKYNLKLVVDLHENWPALLEKAVHTNTFLGKTLSPISLWRKYERDILKKADLIVTVVDEMKERIKSLGIQNDIVVLENTIDLKRFGSISSEKYSKKENFNLIFAGGLNVERGLQYVIKGIKIAKQNIPNLKLTIIGKGSYKVVLESLVKKNQVENQVEFLGWQPLDKVLKLTSQADVSLIPHLKWEQTDCSSPNKIFQCMLVGVPLLVSNCNSLVRLVKTTKSGLFYPFDDYQKFADLLLYLYQHPEERKQMGENGTKAVLTKYNWDNTVKDFLDRYKKLLTSSCNSNN